jgi:hypothetical protein
MNQVHLKGIHNITKVLITFSWVKSHHSQKFERNILGHVCFEKVPTIAKDLKKYGSFLLTKIIIHIKIVIYIIKHTNVCLL